MKWQHCIRNLNHRRIFASSSNAWMNTELTNQWVNYVLGSFAFNRRILAWDSYECHMEDYLLTNWLAYLYGRIQSPRPDVMPDRREGITRAAGFVFACIDTQAS